MIVHLNERRDGKAFWGRVPVETEFQVKQLSLPSSSRTSAEAVQEFDRILNHQIEEVADALYAKDEDNQAWIELPDGRKLQLVPVRS